MRCLAHGERELSVMCSYPRRRRRSHNVCAIGTGVFVMSRPQTGGVMQTLVGLCAASSPSATLGRIEPMNMHTRHGGSLDRHSPKGPNTSPPFRWAMIGTPARCRRAGIEILDDTPDRPPRETRGADHPARHKPCERRHCSAPRKDREGVESWTCALPRARDEGRGYG